MRHTRKKHVKTLGEILLLTATQAIAQRRHREGDDERNPGNILSSYNLPLRKTLL